ncbi:hypothetical protein JTB14_014896 [Gonioctena quinquepunctata]|nr:hypothetical protein JTB14_014896 [Gonioctena quinquepunctata]
MRIVAHEKFCSFAPKSCPLRINGDCNWQGSESKIVEHYMINHATRLSLEPECRCVIPRFRFHYPTEHCFIMCFAYGTLFKCGWDLNPNTNLLRFFVNYFGSSLEDHKFNYEINILYGESDTVTKRFGSICGRLIDDNLKFVEPYYIDLHYDQFPKYCNKWGPEFHGEHNRKWKQRCCRYECLRCEFHEV